ncbi:MULTISPECIES: hydroxyacid dehydrogenase [Streptomyces]|uniref:Phosphoglycerate dehydrogenase-like enzyme n=2 Tax=Streptomyces TaxID=1883 RepID=A0ABT9LRZ1_STRGD|nr:MULTISPECIES: hydroxyacid dehydrogenase [Streptomyces]MDP9686310.1 phosphoglycerate dehydrogenase-like enzyme [Streptomyces griseoviridis]GGT23043.1 dehydrogenase [Streptomyces griseoviridis]GGU58083.1 dehydrogenase [Streptomyces daghestanicus]GHI33511.1 dehydrogenase [Streptomyces daghestanicus]
MPSAPLPRAVFALDPVHLPMLFPPALMARLQASARIDPDVVVRDFADPRSAAALAGADTLITGWGCPPLGPEVLKAAPRLRAVLHAAGSVRALVSDALWSHGVAVSSAVAANAVPVAEYTLAMILLAGKDAFAQRERYRDTHAYPTAVQTAGIGNVGRRVGIIGASRVGRHLLKLLRSHDLEVLLYDPYVDPAEAAGLGAALMPLEELLRRSDIVSLHAPDTPETHHMLDRTRLALIRDGGVLINTSRGALVDHGALAAELVAGRLQAILDVTDPEPPPAGSPLYRLPNVFLTPHIAGSLGNELERLGAVVVDEVARLAAGQPLVHPVRRADLTRLA